MSKIFDILAKAGYQFQSGGDDILPGTLIKDGQPIGFLMPDLTVSLVATHAQYQDNIDKALGFAIENENLVEMEDGEFILTQFDKTILTASYDYEEEQTTYKVYSIADNSQRAIIDSYDEKSKATQSFAELSGLINGGVTSIQRTTGIERINTFIAKVQEKGYKLIEEHNEAHKQFEITDKDGTVVGYIGANNKLTLTTDAPKPRKELTDLYYKSSPNKIELPTFFERLKDKLKEIGLALRVKLTPAGLHYAINDKHKEIATIDQSQKITYTSLATNEQMNRINNLVAEIQKEKENHSIIIEQEPPQQLENTIDILDSVPSQTTIHENTLTEAELISIATAVFGNNEPINTLSPELLNKLSSIAKVAKIVEMSTISPKTEIDISQSQKELLAEFDNDYDLLQTLDGFNDDEHAQVEKMMHSKYGTTDRVMYVGNLTSNKTSDKSLTQKLQTSYEKAELINNVKAEPKQPQEKER